MNEIKKEHPDFDESCVMSVHEVNQYRQQYIQQLLTREVGTLTDLEKTVMDNINQDRLISDEASEVKNLENRGERWADRIATFGGSWRFIGLFTGFLVVWMIVNVVVFLNKGFDPYPFILLNLILSCIAALQAPVIMMSQNRQEEKDRERAKNDYMVNLKSELEIRMLHEKIDHLILQQQESLLEIQQIQVDMMKELMEQTKKRNRNSINASLLQP
ncbi:DUF1003 domain-containing protein [Chitinophaga sedimenti]|uniref:DUF1003 domain-containing protein n=1 Tax=Chitinophaga sedimenti TaxID=2033606 RepID=UPI002005A413|nr:DUF1003 domain-containing protein [Chitinophaga sedimenti]MCK7558421.1 DUF1003 domain-containing protein [Chitinophaga sedimenti]